MEPDDTTDFLLRLRPLPSSIPAAVRLRRALKCLLRSFTLRCVLIAELPAAGGAAERAALGSSADASRTDGMV